MPEDEVLAVARNLLEALRFFGQARADAEIRDLPGVSLIFCGLNYAAFNAALQAQPIEGDAQELGRLIDLSAEQFHARSLRWTYWVCEDFLKQPLRREAGRVFKRHGLRHLTEAPGMYADHLAPATRTLPSLDVRPVADEQTRTAFSDVMSTAFEIPHSVACPCTVPSGHGGGHSKASWDIPTDGSYDGGGSDHGRRHRAVLSGYAAAASAAGIRGSHHARSGREGAADAGVSRTVLQSTPSGFRLYEAMGYRTVTNFNVFISD